MQSAEPIQAVAPATPGVHPSRWGFHPCDRDTFHKLKRYHLHLYRELLRGLRHARWAAKMPHNRRGAEPPRAPADRRRYTWVLAEYRNARYPKATPDGVVPMDMPRGWEDDLARREAPAE